MDKIFLLNSWPFLVAQTRSVIDRLQVGSALIFLQNLSEEPVNIPYVLYVVLCIQYDVCNVLYTIIESSFYVNSH